VRLPKDREAAADVLAKMIQDQHDTATPRGTQNAARRALGLESVERTFTEATGEIDKADRTRKRRVKRTTRAATKAAKGRGIRSLGASGAASPGGLIAQALGLLLLYFVLRNTGSAAQLLGFVRRGVEWVLQPIPLGGRL
jgi:hypothetical protein